jgi:CRP/FNR family transcriptional regulator
MLGVEQRMAATKAFSVYGPAARDCESCISCQATRSGLLSHFPLPTLMEFLRLATKRTYAGGEVLFREGEPATDIFVVCKGRVRVSVNGTGEDSLILNVVEPGTVLGLTATITGHGHNVTATTVWPSELELIPRDEFLEFINYHHELWLPISRQLSEYCETACRRIRAIGLPGTAITKLSHLLLDWVTDADGRVSETFVLPVSKQEEIGRIIGVSRETVNRLFRDLKRRRIVQMRGSVLHILDAAALTNLAQQ